MSNLYKVDGSINQREFAERQRVLNFVRGRYYRARKAAQAGKPVDVDRAKFMLDEAKRLFNSPS
jgi:hypothetical protein